MSTTLETTRINLRASAEAKALIEQAAALMGTTVSGFMLQNAYDAARKVVIEHDTLRLSQSAFHAFISTCEQTPTPNAALQSLMARR
jgi:uncharacterized protein (DUF1778 family)